MNIKEIFNDFMNTYDLYEKPIPGYKNRYINRLGQVYDECGNYIKPYHYDNQYDTIYVRSYDNQPHVIGVHQAVAMVFDPNYFTGCVVHHIDGNKYNNYWSNLEVVSRSDHTKHHNPPKYYPIIQNCQVCGNSFIWKPSTQRTYYIDIARGRRRKITCSRRCAARL